MRGRKVIIVTAAVILMAAVAYQAYAHGLFRFNYPAVPDGALGLDVSHHQGEINWGMLPKDVRYVYIKATEGGDWVDKRFAENWQGAKNAGLEFGAYHFFTLCRAGGDQADNFVATVPVDSAALAPAIDLEFVGNCIARPSREDFLKELSAFMDVIVETYPQRPIIYTTYEFYEQYIKGTAFADDAIWLRDVFATPPADFDWAIWQFADNARVSGIKGPVDMNLRKQD